MNARQIMRTCFRRVALGVAAVTAFGSTGGVALVATHTTAAHALSSNEAMAYDGYVYFFGGPEANNVSVTRSGDFWIIEDTAHEIDTRGDCTNIGVGIAKCPRGAHGVSIEGHGGNDKLRGTADADRIHGGSGNDEIRGGGGDDMLIGESGNDKIFGDDGEDSMAGDDGDDTLTGGAGNDWFNGWTGKDVIKGGDGNDVMIGWAGNDQLNGEDGNDDLQGRDGADKLNGGAGNDKLDGGCHDPELYTCGTDRGDVLSGGADHDWVTYLAKTRGVIVSLDNRANDGIDGAAEGDNVKDDVEDVTGTQDDDVLIGSKFDNQLYGTWGDDEIYGRAGNDVLFGELGRDSAWGEAGNDTMIFRYGSDGYWDEDATIDCGEGTGDKAQRDLYDPTAVNCEDEI